MNNLFGDVPTQFPEELVQTILAKSNVRIQRIVSYGHASPDGFWYDQDQNEWILLAQGAARLGFEDTVVAIKPDDFIDIPAHRKHRVEWTTPDEKTIWLAVFYE